MDNTLRLERLRTAQERFKALNFTRLVEEGVLTETHAASLGDAIRARKTLVVAGTVGTKKQLSCRRSPMRRSPS